MGRNGSTMRDSPCRGPPHPRRSRGHLSRPHPRLGVALSGPALVRYWGSKTGAGGLTFAHSRFVASDHILALPWTATVLPIAIPTVYLWILDAVALQRGTWVIESGTKYGLEFCGLEIE